MIHFARCTRRLDGELLERKCCMSSRFALVVETEQALWQFMLYPHIVG